MKIDWSQTTCGVANSVDEVPKGARIDAVDDVQCVGLCEGCGKPILEGDFYYDDGEDTLTCGACIPDESEAQG